jgi:PDZ domain/PEGA domain
MGGFIITLSVTVLCGKGLMDRVSSTMMIAVLSVVGLPGCATITRGTTEILVINSDPLGADVDISDGHRCRTPCSVELKRKHDYHVMLQKDGYERVDADVRSHTDDAGAAGLAGNVILGGLIGLAVDSASGATKGLQPNPLDLRLVAVSTAQPTSQSPPAVLMAFDRRAPPLVQLSTPTPGLEALKKRDIGATFGASDQGLSVISINKNGPAARAGLKRGDVITQINGQQTAPLYWKNAETLLSTTSESVQLEVLGKGERILTFAQ